jgi:hypothetical protein
MAGPDATLVSDGKPGAARGAWSGGKDEVGRLTEGRAPATRRHRGAARARGRG